MRARRLKVIIMIAVALIIFALGFFLVGILTPSSEFNSIEGFGKVFAASPEFEFDSGSFITNFGGYSFSINFTFAKPFLSLLSHGPVIHVNFLLLAALLFVMLFSCVIPEVSSATSAVFAILVGISSWRIISVLKGMITDGAPSWDVAAGSFWFVSFLYAVLIVNGLVGIGGKIFNAFVVSEWTRISLTLIVATLLANALALILCLFVYLAVGLGWCGGVMLFFALALVLVIFLEIMDLISL